MGANIDSTAYRAGYADGCDTAHESRPVSGGPVRDDKRYAKDPSYRAGWNAGNATCRATPPPKN